MHELHLKIIYLFILIPFTLSWNLKAVIHNLK